MISCDVNVLVHAHNQDDARHEEFRAWLETAANGPEPFGVPSLVASGFLRVVTHPRVPGPSLPASTRWTAPGRPCALSVAGAHTGGPPGIRCGVDTSPESQSMRGVTSPAGRTSGPRVSTSISGATSWESRR